MPTNFITDGTTLPFPKVDDNPLPVTESPSRYILASDWNAACQALVDTQTFLRGNFELFDTNGANAVKFLNVSGSPDAVVTAAKGSLAVDRTNVKLYKNTDGGTSWAEVGASTGSLTMSTTQMASPGSSATVNFSTEGTLDWFAPIQVFDANNGMWLDPGSSIHTKNTGPRYLLRGCQAIWGNSGYTTSQTFTKMTRQATASDDTANAAITSNAACPFFYNFGVNDNTATGMGYSVIVPADGTSRRLRVYILHTSCDIQGVATLTDGSAAQVNSTVTTTTGQYIEHMFEINFKSVTGGSLIATFLVTANHNGPLVGFGGATLA